MKKLLLLIISLLTFPYSTFAEEDNGIAVVESVNEANKEMKLYPKNHQAFGMPIDQQTKLMNRLLASKGKSEVIRFFLSLKNHDEKKAIDLLSKYGNEDLRLLILENLSVEEFAKLLDKLFEGIGGEAIEHWGYKLGLLEEKLYMIPNVRAQQFINFYMNYNSKKTVNLVFVEDDKEIFKMRGQKIAEALNSMDDDKVIEILYGRADTCFVRKEDRIVASDLNRFILNIKECKYSYQSKNHWNDQWTSLLKQDYDSYTQPSHVLTKLIKYIVPHLKPRLVISVFEKETKGDSKALFDLVMSLGCKKAFNELFEYLEDTAKGKVFDICGDDDALFDMLGFESENNGNLQLTDGAVEQKGDL